MREVLYEECARNAQDAQRAKICKTMFGLSVVFAVLFVILLYLFLQLAASVLSGAVEDDNPSAWNAFFFLFIALLVACFAAAVLLFVFRNRPNPSFDYTFVSGELRIAKVFNSLSRKLMCVVNCEEILKVGKVGSHTYERLKGMRDTKESVLTPNKEPAEGKGFYYLYLNGALGKTLYVLECREEMIANVLQFAKRGVLEEDYR